MKCIQCNGEMKKDKKTESSIVVQLFGVVVFFIGLGLLLVFPIGTFFGAILMIASARMGYKRIKVWKCTACGYYFNRM